jgi:hypothetical protein
MASVPIVPQPTGNPILDNPTLKAALAAKMAQPQPSGTPPTMPAPGSIHAAPTIGGPPPMVGDMGNTAPPPNLPSGSGPQIKAPRGTVQGDEAKRSELLQNGSGISRIAHNIEGTQFGQNHPLLGKVAGIGLQGLATLGDTALSLTGPGRIAESMIPGTAGYHAAQLRNVGAELAQDETNQEKQAQTANLQAEVPLRQAQAAALPNETADKHNLNQSEIDKNEAEVKGLQNPFGKLPDNEPIQGVDQLNKGMSDRYQILHPGQQTPTEFQLPANATKGDFDRVDKLLTAEETASGNQQNREQSNQIREAMLALATQNAGGKNLWSVPQPDGTSKVVQLKEGDTVPKGAVSLSGQSTQNAKAGGADVQASLTYANDYLKSNAFTGPGDEALQDQFFNLAKPSTGFRMNQAQIDQLHNMASWMDSWRGKAYHAVNGTWFAPEQRKQIVDTMNALANSKGVEGPGGNAAGGTGTITVDAGGKTYTFKDQASADKFKAAAGIK